MTPSGQWVPVAVSESGSGRDLGWLPGPFRRRALALTLLLAVVGTALVATCTVFLVRERRHAVLKWESRLAATAEFRRAFLELWIANSKDDARVVSTFPSVATPGPETGRSPAGADSHLAGVLAGFSREEGYLSATLVDGHGIPIVGVGPLPRDLAAIVATFGESGTPVSIKFASLSDGRQVAVTLAAVSRDSSRPPRFVVLVADPATRLWPLLLPEPEPTRTGETTLAARRGDQIVFLSPPKARNPPTGASPIPLKGDRSLLALATAGRETVGEFLDHRGVRVLAATRFLPAVGWSVVVKLDLDEALEETRLTERWGSAVLVALFLSLCGAIWGLWRNERLLLVQETARHDAKYRNLIEQANDAIFAVDPVTGRIRGANPAAARMYGRSPEELTTLTVFDLRPDREKASGPAQLATERTEGHVFETTHIRKDGTPFPVEISSRRVEGEGAALLLSIVRDISDRKAAEERATFLGRLYRVLYEASRGIVEERDRGKLAERVCRAIVDQGGFLMAWIGRAREDGRVEVEASSGDSNGYLDGISVRWDDSAAGRGPTGTAIREGKPCIAENWSTDSRLAPWRERGVGRGFRLSAAFPFAGGGEKGALNVYGGEPGLFAPEVVELLSGLAADVGFGLQSLEAGRLRDAAEEEVRWLTAVLEQTVAKRTAALEARNRDLEAFSYSVSHDLRAPLRAIDGFARLLEEGYASRLDEEGLRLLGTIQSNAKRMSQLIDSLLLLSRVARQDFHTRPVIMKKLAETVWAEVLPVTEARKSTFVLGEIPPAEGDPILLRQVLANLLANAVKFTSHKRARRVEVGSRQEAGETVFFVSDNGAGFDQTYADKLFGVFQRLHGRDEFEGTGVGLAIVRRIVQRHGGRVWAEGRPNEGATFSFTLAPATQGQEGARPSRPETIPEH